MNSLSRIVRWCLTALFLIGLFGCQSVSSAPASVAQSLRQANNSASAVDSLARVTPVVSAPDPSVLSSLDREKPSAPKPDGLVQRTTSSDSTFDSVALQADKKNVRQNSANVVNPPTQTQAASVSIPARPFNDADLYLHLPQQTNSNQPLRVLLVLHGMGGQGAPFSQSLIAEADRNNWVIVAPNLPYRDYMDLKQLTEDDLLLTKRVADTLNSLPKRLNLKFRSHALVYGFSRGAQLGHRFAMMYPDNVASVATLSAGSYTLPLDSKNTDKGVQRLPFPFGTGDLDKLLGRSLSWSSIKRVSFWIAVGDKDNCNTDVPRAFDQYIGDNRVDRARAFEQSLRAQGIKANLVIFPNVGHEITGEMRKNALQYLRERELSDHASD